MKQFFNRLEHDDSTFDATVLALIFALGLVLRYFFIQIAHGDPTQSPEDPRYYSLIAQNLVTGKGFIEGGARAYRPPAFPWFLAAVYAVAGVKVAVAQFALAMVGALHPVLTALWVRLVSNRRVGYFVGLLAAVHPQFIRYPQTLYTESLYLFILALATLLLIRAAKGQSTAGFLFAGAAFGWGALTREVTLIAPLLIGLWFYVARRQTIGLDSARAFTTRNWLVFTLGMVMLVLPWTARNYRVFHALVPISTNSGINFYIGNSPRTGHDDWKVAPGVQWRDGAGELQAHRVGLQAGLAYVKSHPVETVIGWFKKAVMLWMPPVDGYTGLSLPLKAMRAAWLLFSLLALGFGIYGFRNIRENWHLASLPLLLAIGFSLPYLLSFVTSRFRLPMESWLLFYTGLGIESFLSRRLAPKTNTTSPSFHASLNS